MAGVAGLRLFLPVLAAERAPRRWLIWPACWAAGRRRPTVGATTAASPPVCSTASLLLNDRVELFDFTVHGEAALTAVREQHGGCFLFGAHLGSFEVVRAAGRHMADVRTSLVMYEDNARKTNAVLNAINPALAIDIIGLGRPGSMLAVKDRLDEGHLVGVLADRSLESERRMAFPFLGASARFPVGPFRMAAMLGRPVVLMLGLHRGDRRYDIIFETISATPAERTDRADDAALRRAA